MTDAEFMLEYVAFQLENETSVIQSSKRHIAELNVLEALAKLQITGYPWSIPEKEKALRAFREKMEGK